MLTFSKLKKKSASLKAGYRKVIMALGTLISASIIVVACLPPQVPPRVAACMDRVEAEGQAYRDKECPPGREGWLSCKYRGLILQKMGEEMDKCWEGE